MEEAVGDDESPLGCEEERYEESGLIHGVVDSPTTVLGSASFDLLAAPKNDRTKED